MQSQWYTQVLTLRDESADLFKGLEINGILGKDFSSNASVELSSCKVSTFDEEWIFGSDLVGVGAGSFSSLTSPD